MRRASSVICKRWPIGIDVVLGVLVFTTLLVDDVATVSLAYQGLGFLVWPLFTAGLVSLASGVTLGLGTRYGVLTYWWVATKLVLNIVLTGLVLILLRPGLLEAVEYGRQLAAGSPVIAEPDQLIFPPIVSSTALLVAVVLAVYKPWGRIRERGSRAAGRRRGRQPRRGAASREGSGV